MELLTTALKLTRKAARNLRNNSHVRAWRALSARRRSRGTFIAVTGSSGKSTTVGLLSHILSGVGPVQTQVESNREGAHVKSLQVPLSANSFYVGETGAEGPGSMRPMLDFLKPSVGIVTLVALEHKSAFRTCEAIAEEKAGLVEVLPAGGIAVLNADDPRVAAMAARTKARVVTFGQNAGDYRVSNIRCVSPGSLSLDITHADSTYCVTSRLTGAHQSVALAAAFAAAHQMAVPPSLIAERIAGFEPIFGRCSVHRAENGPVFIVDSVKAPFHSIQLALGMMARFDAPRKRVVIGQISDTQGGSMNDIYRRLYRSALGVADQVIFVGEHSHRSKATPEDIAQGRFARFETVKQAADFLKETATPDEIILLKGSGRHEHLERLMLTFFAPVRCWEESCGKRGTCVNSCGLYEVPYAEHRSVKKHDHSLKRGVEAMTAETGAFR